MDICLLLSKVFGVVGVVGLIILLCVGLSLESDLIEKKGLRKKAAFTAAVSLFVTGVGILMSLGFAALNGDVIPIMIRLH